MTMPISNSAAALPADLLGGLRNRPVPTIDPAQAAKAKDAAQDFEAFFVTHAFEDMSAGLSSDPEFGGGEGEDMFKSLLLQEYGKQVAKHGGAGISDMVQKQLLQLQETPK